MTVCSFPVDLDRIQMGQEVIYHIGSLVNDRHIDTKIHNDKEVQKRMVIDKMATSFLRRSTSNHIHVLNSQVYISEGTNEFALYQRWLQDKFGQRSNAYCARRINHKPE